MTKTETVLLLLREQFPNLHIIIADEKCIYLNSVVHYKQIFRTIKGIALIREYILQPSNGTTIIKLH